MVMTDSNLNASYSLDTNKNFLIVNQDATQILSSMRNNDIIFADADSDGVLDTAEKLYFFRTWKIVEALPDADETGLFSARPDGTDDKSFYATDLNTLFLDTNGVTADGFDAGTVMNYVGLDADKEEIERTKLVAGQKYYATDTKTVYEYVGSFVSTSDGDTAADFAGANGYPLDATAAAGDYHLGSDGFVYYDQTIKLAKPIAITTLAAGKEPYSYALEGNGDTFEIMATRAALTPTTSLIDFKGNVELFDLPAGTYAYSVKTTFPDGRVVENADNATISASGNDSLGKVTPTSLSLQFENHWKLEVLGAVVGTYSFEFKFGPLTRNIKVIVKENSQVKVTNLKYGTTDLVLWQNQYQFIENQTTTAKNANVVATITPVALPSDAHYQITLAHSSATDLAWTSSSTSLVAITGAQTLTQIPETFASLTLGRLFDDVLANPSATFTATATVRWFEKVLVGVNLASGVQVFAYNQIGEVQAITLLSVAN
jgi:hypothetical protein